MKNTPLKEDHLFRKAYSKGRSAAGRYAVVYLLKDTATARFCKADPLHRPLNRLGLTVGKKLGGAVERNRAKRLLREAYRQAEKNYPGRLCHGYILVLAARSSIVEAKEPEVYEDLLKSFGKVGLILPKAES